MSFSTSFTMTRTVPRRTSSTKGSRILPSILLVMVTPPVMWTFSWIIRKIPWSCGETGGDLEILGDYGNAYLFQLYLYEQFGEKFTRNLFQNRKQGIAGINDVLSQMGKGKNKGLNFEKVYADYMTALIVDAKYKGSDRFQFRSIDLKPDVDAAANWMPPPRPGEPTSR